jgi:heme/copper-type cytochrome/quinol oxidase subunit 4
MTLIPAYVLSVVLTMIIVVVVNTLHLGLATWVYAVLGFCLSFCFMLVFYRQ